MLLAINGIAFFQARHTGNSYEIAGTVEPKTSGFSGGDITLIVISVLFEFIMLVMPLISVFRNAFSKGVGFYIEAITTGFVGSALKVTLLATFIALIVNSFFGIVASWLMTRFKFKGKQVLGALIDIPFSVSPVIAGLAFIMMFGRLGWAFPILEKINAALGTDIQIVFALPGVVLATIFVTFPFVSREIIPVLNAVGSDEEEAAAMMGASGMTIFKQVTFPHIKWSLIYGMILCGARALGEFGAVNALSKTRGETFTLPLEIDALYLSGSADSITAAFAVSSLLLTMAIVVLVLRNIFEKKDKEA
ncbi:MAG: sulfate ABC transporter permease subunit [Lachnospiraceae bacterium]|nr:sulfate ABC transporter permease subunit [Lachnospiraceae bacterium]